MRPDIVVVVTPESELATGIGQAVKDLFVEAFVAQAAVEALDKAILLRLAGINVVPLDTIFGCPFQDGLAGKLGPIVTDDASRFSIDPDQGVEFPRHPDPGDAGIGNQGKVLAAAIVVDRQDAELSAGPEGIG